MPEDDWGLAFPRRGAQLYLFKGQYYSVTCSVCCVCVLLQVTSLGSRYLFGRCSMSGKVNAHGHMNTSRKLRRPTVRVSSGRFVSSSDCVTLTLLILCRWLLFCRWIGFGTVKKWQFWKQFGASPRSPWSIRTNPDHKSRRFAFPLMKFVNRKRWCCLTCSLWSSKNFQRPLSRWTCVSRFCWSEGWWKWWWQLEL